MADEKQPSPTTATANALPEPAPSAHEAGRHFGALLPDLWNRFDWPNLRAVEARAPKVDVVEREQEIVVRAELPGVAKDDIEVTLGEGTLTIRLDQRAEQKEENGEYVRREISSTRASRTVSLPAPVDNEAASASLDDGVLEVRVPKTQGASRRRVQIDS